MVEDSDDENISIDNSLSSDESEGDEEDSDFPKQSATKGVSFSMNLCKITYYRASKIVHQNQFKNKTDKLMSTNTRTTI
jgi:hypothetical protein